jgi:outer membrane lipoprotein-sorting protein
LKLQNNGYIVKFPLLTKEGIKGWFQSFSLLLIFLSGILINSAIAQDIQTVYDNLIQKFGTVNSVRFDVKGMNNRLINGSMTVKRGDKYVFDLNKRKIVCDGQTVWNYSLSENKVVISSYEPSSDEELRPETFFFALTNDFEAVSLKKENSSNSKLSLVLVLKPKSEADKYKEIQNIDIRLDTKSYNIKSVQVYYSNPEQNIEVTNIMLNKPISDSLFDFDIPKDASVIDLR